MRKLSICLKSKLAFFISVCLVATANSMEPPQKKAKVDQEVRNPKSLFELCMPAVIKLKEIPIEMIPCFHLLGLVELEPKQNNTELREDLGSKEIQEKEFVNINCQEHFTKKTFKVLITEQYKKDLPYILAVVTTKQNGKYVHTYYDAHGLNNSLFGSNFKSHRYIYNHFKKFEDSILSQPIINEVKYFIIDSPESMQAKLLGTDYDLCCDKNKKKFMKLFFGANKDNRAKQNNLAFFYQDKGFDMDQAKLYFYLAASKGSVSAQFNLAYIFEKENDIKQAKYHFSLAAAQGHDKSQSRLGSIYNEEGDMEQAKHYHMLAEAQNYARSIRALAYIFYKERNFERAKYYFNRYFEVTKNDDTIQAQKNYSNALFTMGVIYKKENNRILAKEFFAKAASKGHQEAQIKLALMYKKEGAINIAKSYLVSLADKNNLKAHYELGLIYKEEANALNAQANIYLSKAFNGGIQQAAQYMDIEKDN